MKKKVKKQEHLNIFDGPPICCCCDGEAVKYRTFVYVRKEPPATSEPYMSKFQLKKPFCEKCNAAFNDKMVPDFSSGGWILIESSCEDI